MANDDVSVQIRRQNVTWREVDGTIIALDLGSSTYFTTNRTGKLLWQAMIDGAKVSDLVALLQSSFNIPNDRAVTDVRNFLQLLDANDLLRRVTL